MGRILAISSQVVRGHVGLSAIVPALQRLGHDVFAVPTIVLSNHPGHPRAAGTRLEVNTLMSMLEVLDANGWLTGIDAVMTGYLPTPAHVDFATRAIDLVRERNPELLVLVDPVIGDDPRGLYIEPVAADAIRDSLVRRADVITPNRFELTWLSGVTVGSPGDVAVARAALGHERLRVLATSVPDGDNRLANVSASTAGTVCCSVPRLAKAPHGTGDLLTGLYIGHLLSDRSHDRALGRAVAGVQLAITASTGSSDLQLTLAAGGPDWSVSPPLSVEAHGS